MLVEVIPGHIDRRDPWLLVVALDDRRYRGKLLVFTQEPITAALARGQGWVPRPQQTRPTSP